MQTDNRPLIIADSSVLIKWCVKEEEDREQVIKMQRDFIDDKFNILVPLLVDWEINNFLGRNFTPEIASSKYSNFKMLQLTGAMLTPELSHLAFEIVKKFPGVSFYDASYHALALNHPGLFLTADKKYYDKAKKLGNIMLLKDYTAQ
jgi:predicted nucleic acid-binding protein